ncbi:MAG: hypothetical protein ACTSYD_06495 [Candidatus Heimdallarchaeaceae archaeon]
MKQHLGQNAVQIKSSSAFYPIQLNKKTGFLYSWKVSLPILIIFQYSQYLIYHFYMEGKYNNDYVLVTDPTVYLFLLYYIWLIHIGRVIVNGFEDLFVNPIKRQKLVELFNSETDFLEFENKIKGFFTFKKQLFFGLFFSIFVEHATYIWEFKKAVSMFGVSVIDYLEILWFYIYVDIGAQIIMFFIATAGYTIIVFIIMTHLIGKYQKRSDEKTGNFFYNDGEFLRHFYRFSENVQILGRYGFSAFWRAIFPALLGTCFIIIWQVSPVDVILFSLAILTVISLFFFPQVNIHRILKERKEKLIAYFEQLLRERYVKLSQLISISKKDEAMSKEDIEKLTAKIKMLNEQIDTINRLIDELKKKPTWIFNLSALIQIVFSGLVSFVLLTTQVILAIMPFIQ